MMKEKIRYEEYEDANEEIFKNLENTIGRKKSFYKIMTSVKYIFVENHNFHYST